MEIAEFVDHNSLIPFYSKRGIEELDSYPNKPIFSYIVVDNEKLIGAATCSAVDGFYILEAIAIEEGYTGKNIGSLLIKRVFERLQLMGAKSVIINAKNSAFFEKNGFVLSDRSAVPKSAYSYCADCEDYGIKCFPKIMINEFKNGKVK
ncbi:MAG: GNAT family N-acetyltransferase [Bacilli bacterium]|nr:GNAT family N-acetyltransferase [Bacilli bacterium]